jgi:hypothetical protein
MAERPARRRSLQVQLDYAFDRWRESKLAQAYDILVPGRERLVGARIKESAHETRWPTLLQAKRAHEASLKAFFHAHNAHRPKLIAGRLAAIKAAVPLTQDPGVIVPCRLHAMVLVEQLRVALQAIEQFDRHIAELAPTLPDYRLFAELPGAGPHLAPRLLVAFGEDRQRFQRAEELQ